MSSTGAPTDEPSEKEPQSDVEAGLPGEKGPEGEVPVGVNQGPSMTFPEGGLRAWSVVFGTSAILFSTFGYANAFG